MTTLATAVPLPHCGFRTVWGNCMAYPGVWCSTVRNEGKCVKERDGNK